MPLTCSPQSVATRRSRFKRAVLYEDLPPWVGIKAKAAKTGQKGPGKGNKVAKTKAKAKAGKASNGNAKGRSSAPKAATKFKKSNK